MTVPTIVSGSGQQSNAAAVSGTITLTMPSVITAGQLIIANARVNSNLFSGWDTMPTGWNQVPLVTWNGYGSQLLAWKIADGTEDGTAVVFPTSDNTLTATYLGYTFLVDGAHPTSPIDTHSSTSTGTASLAIPSITTLGPDRLVLGFGSNNPGQTLTDYMVWTDGTEFFEVLAGTNRMQTGTFFGQASAGATGTIDGTFQGIGVAGGGYAIAIAPPSTVETLRPTSINNMSNMTGAVTDIDEDPDVSNGADPLLATDPAGSPTTHGAQDPNTQELWTGSAAHTWTNPSNVFDTSDTTIASYALAANNTDYTDIWKFAAADFTGIPSNAVITGVSISSRWRNNGTANRLTAWVQLASANGTLIGNEQAVNGGTAVSTTLTTYNNTHSGTMPTRAELVSGNFGVRTRIRRSNTVTAELARITVTVTYTVPQTINTSVRVLMDDPVGNLATGTATGEVRMAVNRKGTPTSGNPTARVELHENGSATNLATVIPETSVTSGASAVLSGTFNQNLITNKNNVELWFFGTGVEGATVELDALEWNASIAVVQSQNFNQGVDVTVAVGATLGKAAAKNLAVTVNNAVSAVRGVGKTLARSITGTPTSQRGAAKSLPFSATATITQTGVKGVVRALTFAISAAPTLGPKAITKTIARSVSASPTLSKAMARAIAFAAITSTVITASRTYLRTLTFGITGSPTVQRGAGKNLSINVSSAFTRGATAVGKSLARPITAAPNTQRDVGKVISRGVNAVASTSKNTGKNIGVGASLGYTLSKAVGKTIARPITGSPTVQKAASKVFNFTSTVTATTSQLKTKLLDLVFSVNASPSILRAVTKTLNRTVSATPTKTANVGKTFSRTVSATSSMGAKAVGKTIARPVTAAFNLGSKAITKTIARPISIAVDVATGATLNIQRTLNFALSAAPSINKAASKTLSITRVLQVSATRNTSKAFNFNITPNITIKKAVLTTLVFSVNGTATLIRGFNRTLQFTVNTVRSIGKAVEKANNFVTNVNVSPQKAVGKVLGFDILATVRYIKQIGVSINVNVSLAVDILGRLAGLITGPVNVTISVIKKPQAVLASVPKPKALLKVMSKVFAIITKEKN